MPDENGRIASHSRRDQRVFAASCAGSVHVEMELSSYVTSRYG
jgi:hypothetical protein